MTSGSPGPSDSVSHGIQEPRRALQTTRARAVRATRLLAIALAVVLTAYLLVPFPSLPSDRSAPPAPQLGPLSTTGSLAFLTEVYGNSGPLLDQRLRQNVG